MNFGDFSLYSPLLRLSNMPLIGNGPIGGQHMVRLLNVYAPDFFERYLRGTDIPPPDGLSAGFPEVEFQQLGH